MKDEIEIKRVDWFDERFYRITYQDLAGTQVRWIPSVTSKLGIVDKPYLAKWRGDIGNREADMRLYEAQERGTRIHNAFEMLLKGSAVVYNPFEGQLYTPDSLNSMAAKFGPLTVISNQDEFYQVYKLKKWLDIVRPKILFSEMTVYSLTQNDAGTADAGFWIKGGKYPVNGSKLLEIPEGNYLVDLKTGKSVSDEAYLQTAAYVKCAEEMKLHEFAGTIILHTGSQNKSGIEGLSTLLTPRNEMEENYKRYRLISQIHDWKHAGDTPKVFDMPSILKLGEN